LFSNQRFQAAARRRLEDQPRLADDVVREDFPRRAPDQLVARASEHPGGGRVDVDVAERAIEGDEPLTDALEDALDVGGAMAQILFEALAIADVDDRAEQAIAVRGPPELAGVGQPAQAPVHGDDAVVGGRRLGALERARQMSGHPLPIVGMHVAAPVGRRHRAILGRQPQDAEELGGAARHLVAEVPLEGGDAAGPLGQPQHLLTMPQRVGGLALAPLDAEPFGDRRRQQQRRARQDAHERLQEDQAVVHLRAGEWPGAGHRVPDGDPRRGQHHPRGQPRTAGQRGGDGEREHDVLDRMPARADGRPEHDGHHRERGGDPQHHSNNLPPRPRFAGDGEDDRRDDQRAERIAEPPVEPQDGEARPGLDAGQGQRGDADRGADGGAAQRRCQHVGQDVGDPPERAVEAMTGPEPPDRGDGLERVAGGDQERGPQRCARPGVGEEGAGPDRRPQAQAAQQQGRDRDPGRGPDGRDLFGAERQLEPERRRSDVRGRHDGGRRQPARGRCEGRSPGGFRQGSSNPFREGASNCSAQPPEWQPVRSRGCSRAGSPLK
jgi:hypothetical protein